MTDEPTGKRRSPEQERELATALERRRNEPERKPGPVERDEWRGAGVCGDRHTD